MKQLSRTLLRGLGAAAGALPPGYELEVVSGVRSAAEQAALQRRWDAGDRRGLIARPATYSAHVMGRAVDLNLVDPEGRRWTARDTPELWPWLAQRAQAYGIRWGGPTDPNHFQL